MAGAVSLLLGEPVVKRREKLLELLRSFPLGKVEQGLGGELKRLAVLGVGRKRFRDPLQKMNRFHWCHRWSAMPGLGSNRATVN